MSNVTTLDFSNLYNHFHSPITSLNCGEKCAPYNEHGVPFCCDTNHAIPTAYTAEWAYLIENTDLWHLWDAEGSKDDALIRAETPDDQVLIECLGHTSCQRHYRSVTCRSFPFFPYITENNEFIGLSYYWEYEDRCWVISNLALIDRKYLKEFVMAYDILLMEYVHELENFKYQSTLMRRYFLRHRRAIPLLHRNGKEYQLSPKTGRMKAVNLENLPKYGVYKIAAEMRFSDE